MIFNTFFKFAGWKKAVRSPLGISEFFLHASDSKKELILTKAAHGANKEQMKVFKKAQLAEIR